MISRVDQQIFVTKSMIECMICVQDFYKNCRTYMTNYLAIMMTVSSILLIRSKNARESGRKREVGAVAYLYRESLRNLLEDPVRNP